LAIHVAAVAILVGGTFETDFKRQDKTIGACKVAFANRHDHQRNLLR
jgi:hypothetical protein